MVTFGVGVLLAISGDYLLRYLAPKAAREFNGWEQTLDSVPRSKWLDRRLSLRAGSVSIATVGILCLVCSLFFFRYNYQPGAGLSREELAKVCYFDFDQITQNTLPKEIAGWVATDYRLEAREPGSVFGGLVSHTWRYTNPRGRSVLVSFDGPHAEWHDLSVCYRATGWQIMDMTTIQNESAGADKYACELRLNRKPLDRANVIYVCIDSEGGFVKPPDYFGSSVTGLVRRFGIGMQDSEGAAGGVVQLQIFDQTPGEINATRQQENLELFWAATSALMGSKK